MWSCWNWMKSGVSRFGGERESSFHAAMGSFSAQTSSTPRLAAARTLGARPMAHSKALAGSFPARFLASK